MVGVGVEFCTKDFLFWVILEDQTHFDMPRGYFKVTQTSHRFSGCVGISGARGQRV